MDESLFTIAELLDGVIPSEINGRTLKIHERVAIMVNSFETYQKYLRDCWSLMDDIARCRQRPPQYLAMARWLLKQQNVTAGVDRGRPLHYKRAKKEMKHEQS